MRKNVKDINFCIFFAVNIFGIEFQAQQNESVSWDAPGVYSADFYEVYR